ncbi:hypothetical protein NUW54_g10184 [Trametes sanguinea]|uniref:Uncharacterized protein n=1 Tax=Trametes sanguinea TaxID=158606 RepID=A0ACC1P3W6_9APHY|nr:hypothetical protein NUW54_g10184 [Trametes sanguinea]
MLSYNAHLSLVKRQKTWLSLGKQVSVREQANADSDEVVKSSTDKLSAVFDWLVEQVPASRSLGARMRREDGSSGGASSQEDRDRDRSAKRAERSDLETKKDLERFYVALCRKLYDEGL